MIKLFKKDSKGKIRKVLIELEKKDDNTYRLERRTGLIDGKLIENVDIISKGKAGRTVEEQALLVQNSKINSYKDKGYKTLEELGLDSLANISDILNAIGDSNTDAKGRIKPMLASKYDLRKSYQNFLIQPKLNGVRCLMFKEDDKIIALSRQGKDYTIPCTYIIEELEEFFKYHPDIILDGEIYVHGKPLQEISGLVRKKELEMDHYTLQYHIYDIVNELEQTGRTELLSNITKDYFCHLPKRVHIVDTIKTPKDKNNKDYLDFFISRGYEGAILRNPNGLYAKGQRSKDLVKLKKSISEEFEIVGFETGKRKHDLIIKCIQEDGKEFKVTASGTKRSKINFLNRLSNGTHIGSLYTVEYFERTKDNIPLHSVGIEIRDYE